MVSHSSHASLLAEAKKDAAQYVQSLSGGASTRKKRNVIVEIDDPRLGKLRWKLPANMPSKDLSSEDVKSVQSSLKPHLAWILTVLVAGLKLGRKNRRLLELLQKTEKDYNAESLGITLGS